MVGKAVDVFALAYEKDKTDVRPVVWVTAYPAPYESRILELVR